MMDMAGTLAGLVAPNSDAEINRLLAAYGAKLDDATKGNSRKAAKKVKVSDGDAA